MSKTTITGSAIKVLNENTTRPGSVRHAILDGIFSCKTVEEALVREVKNPKDGEMKPIRPVDLHFAADYGYIAIK